MIREISLWFLKLRVESDWSLSPRGVKAKKGLRGMEEFAVLKPSVAVQFHETNPEDSVFYNITFWVWWEWEHRVVFGGWEEVRGEEIRRLHGDQMREVLRDEEQIKTDAAQQQPSQARIQGGV